MARVTNVRAGIPEIPARVLTPGPVLAWMGTGGDSVPAPEILDGYHERLLYPRLSPDAGRLAIELGDGSETAESGLLDMEQGGTVVPLAPGTLTSAPEWSPGPPKSRPAWPSSA